MAIELHVYKTTLEVVKGEPVLEGGIRANDVVFHLTQGDDTWADMALVGLFETRLGSRAVLLDENGECVLPWEVIAEGSAGSTLRIGLYGTKEDDESVIVRNTVWAQTAFRVLPGPDADPGLDPTPDQYQQMLTRVASVMSRMDTLSQTESSVAANAKSAQTAASSASGYMNQAKDAATAAQTSAQAAQESAQAAQEAGEGLESAAEEAAASAAESAESQESAAGSAQTAQTQATAAESWAVGGTGSRIGEDQDNAKYYAQRAKESETATSDYADAAQEAQEAAETARGAAETAAGTAQNKAESAAGYATEAQGAKMEAQAAQEAIENMEVAATTLAAGSAATVTKTTEGGVVKLTYGIPKGEKGDKGDKGDQGPAGAGSGDMLASVYDPQGKAEDVFAYAEALAQAAGGVPIVAATSTDGVNYTATVPGLETLENGKMLVIVPNRNSASNQIMLNVNGSGAIAVYRKIVGKRTASTNGNLFFSASHPSLLVFTSHSWYDFSRPKTNADDVTFTPGTTGLTSDDVQGALEELAERESGITQDAADARYVKKSGDTMTGNLDMGNNVLKFKEDDGTEKISINRNRIYFFDNSGNGGTVVYDESPSETEPVLGFYGGSGDESVKLSNIADPTSDRHAANKGYVDGLKPKAVTITLPASVWSNNVQGAAAQGVTTSNAVLVTPAPASWTAAGECGVYCSEQRANLLIFTCSEVPAVDLTYNVLIWEVQ